MVGRATMLGLAAMLVTAGAMFGPANAAPGVGHAQRHELRSTAHAPVSTVLTETVAGGYVPTQIAFIDQLPRLALYSDGRIFRVVPSSAGFTHALVRLSLRALPASQVQQIVTLAHAAGVMAPTPDLGTPMVTDLPTTTFVLTTDGVATVLNAPGLGFTEGLTADQIAARARLSAFAKQLDGIAAGQGAGPRPHPYVPTSLSVFAQPAANSTSGTPKKWPLGKIRATGTEFPCFGVSDPAKVKRVLPLAAAATSSTLWTSGGARWQLIFRPDLPGHKPCR